MKTNSCIVYLTCLNHIPLLIRSVILLHKHWKYANKYPIIIFHDDLSSVNISQFNVEIFNHLGYIPNILWNKIQFSVPPHISTDESKYLIKMKDAWLGYRHMCNFQSYGIYDTVVGNYDYYLRLDSDSYLLSDIDYDMFEYMQDNDLVYGYLSQEETEVDSMCVDLWHTTEEFMKKSGVDRSIIDGHLEGKDWDKSTFYTNFEISRVDTFKNSQYKSYYDCLDSTGKIYYNRWGDAPIHWLGVRMFVPDNKVWCIKDVAYQHNMWIKNLSAIKRVNGVPTNIDNLTKYIDPGRKSRFDYAWDRHLSTGADGVNWGE